MEEKNISIDVEVIKKSQIYELSCLEASDDETTLQKTESKSGKWQSFKNKIKDKILRKEIFV